jgi:hypothetical protein
MKTKLMFPVLAAILGALASSAQTKPPAAGIPVKMVVSAEPQQGKEPPAIGRDHVRVTAEGKDVPVKDWVPLQGAQADLELYILMDDSLTTSVTLQFSDFRRFTEQQPATTSIGLAYMRNGVAQILQPPTRDHTKVADQLRMPLSTLGAMTSPFLSLSDLIKRWPASSARREILMVTSGVDPMGDMGPQNPYMDSAIDQAQRAGIIVYAIYAPGIGHGGHSYWRVYWAQNHLAELTDETGGEAYMLGFGPPVSFAPYLDDLAMHLAHQYMVTFLATPRPKAGFQSVKVTTDVPNADLVTATRVWVPAEH